MTTSSIVSKSSRVLDAICASGAPLSFTQIARHTGLPKSSAHRILSILMAERLIACDRDRQTYQPGARLIGWAVSAFRANDLPGLSAAEMEGLNEKTGAHVALSILEGSSVLYLKTVDSIEPYRLAPRVGERSAIHACAAGKAMLAHVRPKRREAIVSHLKLERYTEHTIVSRKALVEDLRRIRDVGFAMCDREEFLQVAGISAPVFGHHGEVVAAISLWNIVEHQGIEELLSFGNDLLSATGTLSARLGLEATRSITN